MHASSASASAPAQSGCLVVSAAQDGSLVGVAASELDEVSGLALERVAAVANPPDRPAQGCSTLITPLSLN